MRLRYYSSLLVLVAGLAAQNPVTQPVISTRDVNIPIATPPLPVPGASTQVIGNPGNSSYFYWVVAKYTVGNATPAGPFPATQVPSTLSGSNYVQISWATPTGATGYDILRTTAPVMPSGNCACAVATAVTSTSTNDQSNTLNAYTVATLDPSTLAFDITNEATGAGTSGLYQTQNGVRTALGGGGGALPITGGGTTVSGFNTAVPYRWLTLDPVEAASGSFYGTVGPFPNGGSARLNQVLMLGYNQLYGGASDNGTDPAWYMAFENFYQPGAPIAKSEWYIQHTTVAGVGRRPFAATVNTDGTGSDTGMSGEIIHLDAAVGGGPNIKATTSSTVPWGFYFTNGSDNQTVPFLTTDRNAALASTTALSFVRAASNDYWNIGSGLRTTHGNGYTAIGGSVPSLANMLYIGTLNNATALQISAGGNSPGITVAGNSTGALLTLARSSDGIPRLIYNTTQAKINNGVDMLGYSDNQSTLKWSIMGSSGAAAFNSLAVTGASGTVATVTGGNATGVNPLFSIAGGATDTGTGYAESISTGLAGNGTKLNRIAAGTGTRAHSTQDNFVEKLWWDFAGNFTATSMTAGSWVINGATSGSGTLTCVAVCGSPAWSLPAASGTLLISAPALAQTITPTADVTGLTVKAGTGSAASFKVQNNGATNTYLQVTQFGVLDLADGGQITSSIGNIVISSASTVRAKNFLGQVPATVSAIAANGNVACYTTTDTVDECATSAVNPIGVVPDTGDNSVTYAGRVTANYDATVSPSPGWFACTSAITAGKVLAQVGACSAGRQVGIITASGTNVTSGTILLQFK